MDNPDYDESPIVGKTVQAKQETSQIQRQLTQAAEENDIPYTPDPFVTITVGDVDSGHGEVRLKESTLLGIVKAVVEETPEDSEIERVVDVCERQSYFDTAEWLQLFVSRKVTAP